MSDFDDVAAIAATLPGVEEGEHDGRRSWTVAGKAFAWERRFSKADIKRYGDERVPAGPILAVATDGLVEKEAILADPPPGVFTIPHFDGYAAVLVELGRTTTADLRETMVDGWLAKAPEDLAEQFVRGRAPGTPQTD